MLLIFRCCLYANSTILCYDLASFPFEGHFVISRREVLKTLYSILFTVAEFDFAEAEEKRVLLLIFRCCFVCKVDYTLL